MSHAAYKPNSGDGLPPITQEHIERAWIILAMPGTLTAALQDPWRAKIVQACAASLRTDDWKRTQVRTVVPVRRCRPGVDGHPVKWATQMVMGPYTPKIQHDLLTNPRGHL
jgi:hypothetical protein